ncbi:MAG TPA: peptidase [Mycobacteriales bacterium]|nr:peptidase [Mycobacteriales bacterium]
MRSARPGRRRVVAMALFAALLPTASFAAATAARGNASGPTQTLRDALARQATRAELVPAALAPRRRTPEDRYALAGGCYVMRSVASGKYVGGVSYANADRALAQAERLHLQAIDLGKYLLYTSKAQFVAAGTDTGPGGKSVVDTAAGVVAGTGDESLDPARDPVLGAADSVGTLTGGPSPTNFVRIADAPSGLAEWVVRDAGAGLFRLQMAVNDDDPDNPGPLEPPISRTMTSDDSGLMTLGAPDDTGRGTLFRFELAKGCAVWPEIETNVTGPHHVGDSPYAETKGYFDGHLHLMAFEFLGGRMICGRPWHPYGVRYAMVDCPDHAAGGYSAIAEQVLAGSPHGHDTTGWPTFADWPRWDSLTHQQSYYRWLERSWRGGLRMFTNLLAENGVLCEVYPLKKNRCNEMDSARLQAQRLRELERYIDAQYGGPGEGWFRIVTDPFQARRVINAGKLAVVMGLEVSVPFDCGEYMEIPRCTAADIDRGLDDLYAMGVRQMELINKFDNALGGVAGDDGAFGLLANNGNRYETGHTWKFGRCVEREGHTVHEHRHDKLQENVADKGAPAGRDAIFGAVLEAAGESGTAQVYPPGPHCNAIGLTDLGRHAIDGLMKRGMIFDPDHMSASARKAAMEHVTKAKYSGVISSHGWGDNPTYRQILRLGGVVAPTDFGGASDLAEVTGPEAPHQFVRYWRHLRGYADPRFVFGHAFGSDVTGFSKTPAPRNPDEKSDVDYPFRGLGGALIDQQRSGERRYDVNTDGVSHYGLYLDWIEDARRIAGRDAARFTADVERGAEAYLQMWERAIGVPGNACRPDVADIDRKRLSKVRLGMTADRVLVALGQPKSRSNRTLTFCTERGTASVRLRADGRVRSISQARR